LCVFLYCFDQRTTFCRVKPKVASFCDVHSIVIGTVTISRSIRFTDLVRFATEHFSLSVACCFPLCEKASNMVGQTTVTVKTIHDGKTHVHSETTTLDMFVLALYTPREGKYALVPPYLALCCSKRRGSQKLR
jgi:hypothetical protein